MRTPNQKILNSFEWPKDLAASTTICQVEGCKNTGALNTLFLMDNKVPAGRQMCREHRQKVIDMLEEASGNEAES